MARRASVPEGKALFFRRAEGEEPEPRSPTRQSAVFLEERHIDWLEDKCREARRNGGKAIRKAAIIRALLDVAIAAPVDLTGLRRDTELVERIRQGVRQL
ncbi:MAG TPA: hypothetical protein VG370_26165 [Chloroflexota bacterium]|jgi:hypothetical protein|nr:hypothetical protein [Chloroflexota bacterium]